MTPSPLAERAALSALFWARQRDDGAIRGSLRGLSDAERAEVVQVLEGAHLSGLNELSDEALLERMRELATKAMREA